MIVSGIKDQNLLKLKRSVFYFSDLFGIRFKAGHIRRSGETGSMLGSNSNLLTLLGKTLEALIIACDSV